MVTLSEAKERLGISHVSLNKWLSKLDIKPRRQGKYKYISQDDLDTIKEARETVKPLVKVFSESSSESSSEGFSSALLGKIETMERNHAEQLQLLREQMEHERTSSSEKDRQIADLSKNLDQEQHLHAGTMKQLSDAKEQMRLIEHQPNEELDEMVALLKRTRDTFLQNMKILNLASSVSPLTLHDGGRVEESIDLQPA